jgi:hypothetical protein
MTKKEKSTPRWTDSLTIVAEKDKGVKMTISENKK